MYKSRVTTDYLLRNLILQELKKEVEFAISKSTLPVVYLDFAKWSNREIPRSLDTPMWQAITKIQKFISVAMPPNRRTVSGPEYDEAIRRLDPLSSPGFPWNKKYKTRRNWVANEDHQAHVKWWIKHGECIWNISPKEEIRKIAKLEADQVRDFMAGLVEENVICNIALADFSDYMNENWRLTPFTVGMSPMHGGWDFRIRRWPNHITKCSDVDGAKFDGSVESWCYDVLYYIVSPFLDDIDPVEIAGEIVGTRRYLFLKLCERWKESICVFADGTGCWKWGCNPSGASWTIWVNTFIMAFFRYWHIYDMIHTGELDIDPDEIDNYFNFDFHGDDSVQGACPGYEKYIDANRFNEWAETKGLLVRLTTDGSGLIHEVEYLSHNTIKVNDIWLPVHKTPDKLMASAALKSQKSIPKCSHIDCPGWSDKSYHLARLGGIATQLWPNQEYYQKLARVYQQYVDVYDEYYQNDIHWAEAKRNWLGYKACEALWVNPESAAPPEQSWLILRGTRFKFSEPLEKEL